jgi:hypothetical protein
MKMRIAALILGVVLATAGTASADQVRFHTQIWGANAGGFPGGPFQFEVVSGLHPMGLNTYLTGQVGSAAQIAAAVAARPTSFMTFCLEHNEFISPGTVYNVALATYAYAGGVSNTAAPGGVNPAYGGPGDSLDYRTAYLYSKLMTGTLDAAVSTFVFQQAMSGQAFQQAIWYIEGEQTLAEIGGTSSLAYQLVLNANAAVAPGGSWGATLGNVRVMNLTDDDGTARQSQLIIIPLPPGSGMATAGLTCLFAAAHRRRSRAC